MDLFLWPGAVLGLLVNLQSTHVFFVVFVFVPRSNIGTFLNGHNLNCIKPLLVEDFTLEIPFSSREYNYPPAPLIVHWVPM